MNDKITELWKKLQDTYGEINSLRERIKSGKEGSRNKLDDFVFCSVGENPKFREPFYNLDKQVRGSKGDEILVVRSSREPINFMGYSAHNPAGNMPLNVSSRTEYNFAYGVLTGESLDFDLNEGQIIFPSGEYRFDGSFNELYIISNLKIEKNQGKIRRSVDNLPHLCNHLNLESLLPGLSRISSEILIGSEVGKYMKHKDPRNEIYSQIKNKS